MTTAWNAKASYSQDCAHCATPFETTRSIRIFCSKPCLARHTHVRERDRGKSLEELARWHAAQANPTCDHCGDAFERVNARQRFCCNSCKRKAFHAHHADETELDADGEIAIRDLEQCERRLRIARLFLGRNHPGLPPAPVATLRWANPADKRHSR